MDHELSIVLPAIRQVVMAHVLFDVFGTLLDVTSIARDCDELDQAQRQEVVERLRDAQLELAMLGALIRNYRDFDRISADALELALERTGFGGNSRLISKMLHNLRQLDAFSETLETLTHLARTGHVLGALSNGTKMTLEESLQNAHLRPFFTYVMSAEEVSTHKPDLRAYSLGSETFKAPVESILFVSSNWWDAAGAMRFGYRTLWVNRRGERFPQVYRLPDYESADLREVLEIVGNKPGVQPLH